VYYGPLVEETHQAWKLRAMMIGVGISVLFEAAPFFYTLTKGQTALCAGLGALVALISLAIPFAGLRCPACRSPWMWRAAKQSRPNWLRWLRAQQVCPDCGQLVVPSNNRWRGP
jgi:endogenous inhibitor of DNA gyrase (YacG/DUF329 family)